MLVQCEVREVQCPVSGRCDPEAALVFLPGNGVAASHAPLTAAAFTLGLSLVVLSLTGLALMPAGHPMVGGWISGGLIVAGGLATAVLGAAVLAGRFSAIRAMLLP